MSKIEPTLVQNPAEKISSGQGTGPKIAFLFLHERPHQIPHLAPILEALTRNTVYDQIQAFVMGKENADVFRSLLSQSALSKIALNVIEPPLISKILDTIFGKAAPIQRIGALYQLRDQLRKMDVIASPETTCLMLKRRFGVEGVKIVWTQHGCGDRAAGFKPSIRHFDHVFVPGANQRDRMLKAGVISEGNYTVVGYPKFELINRSVKTAPRPFNNDNPIVVYNPHFDPGISSWFKHGESVLEFFSNRPDFNLIFAPHIMLFTRNIHVGGNLLNIAWRKPIKQQYRNCSNILIDTGSVKSIDMTHIRTADIYLGDVSSQIYEFLHEPRLCIFLNSHNVSWENNPNYAHWRLGEIVSKPSDMGALLDRYAGIKNRRHDAQVTAFRKTFDDPAAGAAQRAADALNRMIP